MSDRKKTRGGSTGPRSTRPRAATGKSAGKPGADWSDHLILSFKALNDPTPAAMAQAIELVGRLAAARVARARPGMLRIEVLKSDKEKVREVLQSLEDWDVSDEAVASMPVDAPFSSS